MSLLQALLSFVALNSIYILPVLLRNAKPNNGRFRNRVPEVSISIKLAVFLASGCACMKLHESDVVFLKLHMRLQSTDFVLVVALVPYKILISRTRTRTSTKRIRLNRMHTPCALNFISCRSYKSSIFNSGSSGLGEYLPATFGPQADTSGCCLLL